MNLVVECKPDEALAQAFGVSKSRAEHGTNKVGVCGQLARREGICGLVDEDPNSHPMPYLRQLREVSHAHGVKCLSDDPRNNRVIVLCPRLEEWLVTAAKHSGVKLTEFGFTSDNGVQLHGEINHRLANLRRVVEKLLELSNPHLFRLRHSLRGEV
jgi:hypothetical protein